MQLSTWDFTSATTLGLLRHETNWKIERASYHLAFTRDAISGRDLEHYLGHVGFLLPLRPEMYSMLGSVYTFVRASYTRRQPLWRSVQRDTSTLESPPVVQCKDRLALVEHGPRV